jgi:predicted nuclease of predicted toxin-antitoxin system
MTSEHALPTGLSWPGSTTSPSSRCEAQTRRDLGRSVAARLAEAGHDIDTVTDEGLAGAEDAAVLDAAAEDQRIFVTNDLDFSDPRRYRPSLYQGIVVIRVSRQTRVEYLAVVDTLIEHLTARSPKGELWIARKHMIRIYGANPR